MALKADGTVWAWGQKDAAGILGDGTTMERHTPVQVLEPEGKGFLSGVKAISSSLMHHTVALKEDGTVWAWGGNIVGQLGDNKKYLILGPLSRL